MRLRNLVGLCSILIVLTACQLPKLRRSSPTATSTPSIQVTLTPYQPESSETAISIPANQTVTLTPGATSSQTALTPSPTPTPARLFPTPQITPASTRIPSPADILPQPAGQVNILFMGSDKRQNKDFRTDIIILVTLRPGGAVSLTSFPRNLYVYLPGKQMQRINATMATGGFDLAKMSFDYNFGFRPDYYILTDIGGYQDIIDTMAGIDVKVAKTFHAARSGYSGGFTVNAGTVHMNGATALWYVRAGSTLDDMDRMRRSQEVLTAMGERLFSLNALAHIPQIYNLFRNNVDTNLTVGGTFAVLPRMLAVDRKKVNRYSIGLDQAIPWTDPITREQYLLPKPEAIRRLLQQAIGTP
jgi:LCP family protein required for cell wall assembly